MFLDKIFNDELLIKTSRELNIYKSLFSFLPTFSPRQFSSVIPSSSFYFLVVGSLNNKYFGAEKNENSVKHLTSVDIYC